MSIEIIGMVGTQEVSESRGSLDGPQIDPGYLTRFARAHEAAGFDRVLIGYGATGADGFAVAGHVLHHTSALKVLIAHRPGFVAPTLVARKLATLDQLTGGGRVAIHHITGGDELDQKRDGDFADHDRRYVRTGEFMGLLRRELTATEPFDFQGEFYKVAGAYSSVRPPAGGIPLYFGGASAAAERVAAAEADVQLFWGEPLDGVRERIERLKSLSGELGREHPPLEFGLRVTTLVRDTSEQAWADAEAKVADMARAQGTFPRDSNWQAATGQQRLVKLAARGEVLDDNLYTTPGKFGGEGAATTWLVGSAQDVARSLRKYASLGITHFVLSDTPYLREIKRQGEDLLPLLRG